LGVEIYPGFAAAELLFDEQGAVRGVATGDMGIGRDGEKTANYTPGIELHAKYTFFAEGCRGSLGKELIGRFELRQGREPQTYGIGIKELWEVEPSKQIGRASCREGVEAMHGSVVGIKERAIKDNCQRRS